MVLLVIACTLLAAAAVLAILLSAQPVVPAQLSAWPSQGFLYLQLIRAAVKGKKPPSSDLKGKPIKVCSSSRGAWSNPVQVQKSSLVSAECSRHTVVQQWQSKLCWCFFLQQMHACLLHVLMRLLLYMHHTHQSQCCLSVLCGKVCRIIATLGKQQCSAMLEALPPATGACLPAACPMLCCSMHTNPTSMTYTMVLSHLSVFGGVCLWL